jgi:hypothetical protein
MDDIIEQWKDIEGYEGIYQISNFGNVKSLSRYINNKHNTLSLIKEKILRYGIDKYGYYIVSLTKNKIQKTHTIHSLVAKNFLENKLNNNFIIDHINNIKTDNCFSNLQYISVRKNNSKDRKNKNNFLGIYKNGTKFSAKIVIDGVRKYLGNFNTPEEANNEYLKNLNLIKN